MALAADLPAIAAATADAPDCTPFAAAEPAAIVCVHVQYTRSAHARARVCAERVRRAPFRPCRACMALSIWIELA